jgi:hypothetical protein
VRFTVALVAGRLRFAFALKLGTIALAGVTSATIEELTVDPHNVKLEMTQLASVQNETVIYRQERPTQSNADQDYSEHPYTEQIEASRSFGFPKERPDASRENPHGSSQPIRF